uniref:UBZ1-type domain-containing protein n=1 Tax=Bactrocera latifrons TaxID=174628 RepID=A0A0K8WLM0_BACLA
MESGPNSSNVLASEYALRVALQTMKERCLALQRRLTELEEDNEELRARSDQVKQTNTTLTSNGSINTEAGELLQLRVQVEELNRQKEQLSEHINMVSNENRKLWSRLSQIAKDKTGQCGATPEPDYTTGNEPDDNPTSPRNGSGSNQNLIRSKTFTQHSPNPNLRHKLIPNGKEFSMEDVALEQKCDVVEDNDYVLPADGDLGFAYLNVDDNNVDDADFTSVAKKCMEGLQEMQREALKQQQELNSALTVIETRIALQPCADCAKKSQKPEMADKSLETDESFSEIMHINKNNVSKGNKAWSGSNDAEEEDLSSTNEAEEEETFLGVDSYYDKVQNVLNMDAAERVCPMCGRKYDGSIAWEAFQQHVEAHFLDRDDIEF